MKRNAILGSLPVVMLVCSLLAEPAQAQFTQQGPKLVGTGAAGPAEQGTSVSLSGDGNTAIVGWQGDNGGAGAAWVYTRSGGVWSEQGPKLVGAGAGGQGSSVSLSGDGNTAIVGAPGAAWVYTRSGGLWSQQGPKLVGTGAVDPSWQGISVSLSGDGNTAIVGGPVDNDGVGAAWVFTRSGGVWSQQGPKLVGTGAANPAAQGVSVALSGDGNTAIVGGFEDDGDGAAWVFTRSAGVWSQQGPKLVGTGAAGFAGQGVSVALSGDGNTAIVGGRFDDSNTTTGAAAGAAWVFTRSGGMWSQQGPKLVGTGAVGPFSAEQGTSVSLSGDGNTAIVGGDADNTDTGAAWVFTRSGGVWSQQGPKLAGTDALGLAQQGYSVSLSGDGSTAIVGGPLDYSGIGAAWVYTQPVFAGTPGKANCHGKSVSALAQQYGGLNNAAAALDYSSVSALQNAILEFCGG
jgi:hypothetical protein